MCALPAVVLVFECDASPPILVAPFPHEEASGSKDFGGTSPNDFISLSVLSLYQTAFDCDFTGADVNASSVKKEDAEVLAKSLPAHALPYAVSGTARDRRRAGRGSAAIQHRAAAHIGVQGWKGIPWYRERGTRGTIHQGGLHEPGTF